MQIEAKRPAPHSRLILNSQLLFPEEQRYVQINRDHFIKQAIKGRLGIPPSEQITRPEMLSFTDANYLRTEVSEKSERLQGERDIVIDTRYVPVSAGPDRFTLRPEVAVVETTSGVNGSVTNVDTVRGFPPGTSKVVAETIHRLMVGLLIDGGTGEDVIRVYDKAMAELNEGSTVKDLITAFRYNSLRGGTFSYLRFRYTESLPYPDLS